eukprot:m.260208 g.260208  ORF g.260208 m.260208 type:complete len:593 (-) comp39436_c0_seq1:588-2366(-)
MPRMHRTASVASLDTSVEEPALTSALKLADVVSRNIPFKSVIKVYCVTSKPNYLLPWQMSRQESCTGSAFCIEGNLLLTNAHVIRDSTTVRVRRHGGSEKFKATVLCVNNACDLALLSVESENDSFFDGIRPLAISNAIPELYENAMVIGYPMGGDNVCVTRGVVSRVTTLPYEDTKFFLPNQELIAIQLDAAINSGNSGGPALDESGRIVGVAFSGYAGSADNIGYIIPYPVINNFLRQFKSDPTVSRICDYGCGYMLCENDSLKRKYKMGDQTGVLVTRVSPLGAAAKAGVQEKDVILSIDGCKIQNDGTIDFRQDERLSFISKVGSRIIGESTTIEILRNGKVLSLEVEGVPSPELVVRHRNQTKPSYMIVGGVIFTPLTCGLLDVAVEVISEEAWQAGRSAMKTPGQQVIVVISVLGHPINHGYDISRLPLLTEFNGEKVLNMKELHSKVAAVTDGFLDFKLGDGKSIILDVNTCRETEEEILKTYAIPAPVSEDLLSSDSTVVIADPKIKSKSKAKAKANSNSKSKDKGKADVDVTTTKPTPKSKPTPRKQTAAATKRKSGGATPVKATTPKSTPSGGRASKRAKKH